MTTELTAPLSDRLAVLAARCELADVVTHRVHAQRNLPGVPVATRIALNSQVGRGDGSSIIYRFTLRCEMVDQESPADAAVIAEVETTIATAFAISDGPPIDDSIDQEVLEAFGNSIALRLAFPYLRESVQSLAGTLRIQGVVLGVLRAEHELPQTVTFHDTAEF